MSVEAREDIDEEDDEWDVFGQNTVMTLSVCRLVYQTRLSNMSDAFNNAMHLALHTAMNTTCLISSSSRTAGFSGARNSRSLIRTFNIPHP